MLGVAGQMMGTLVDTEEEGQGRAQVSQMVDTEEEGQGRAQVSQMMDTEEEGQGRAQVSQMDTLYKNWFLTITFIFIGQMSIIVHQSVLYNILVKSRSSTITCLVIVYCIVSAFIKSMLKNVRSPISQPPPPPSPKKKYFQDQ